MEKGPLETSSGSGWRDVFPLVRELLDAERNCEAGRKVHKGSKGKDQRKGV